MPSEAFSTSDGITLTQPLNRTAALRFRFGRTKFQFAQGGEVGFGSGDQNVGIRALTIDDAVAARQTDAGFALAFRALRYGIDGINL